MPGITQSLEHCQNQYRKCVNIQKKYKHMLDFRGNRGMGKSVCAQVLLIGLCSAITHSGFQVCKWVLDGTGTGWVHYLSSIFYRANRQYFNKFGHMVYKSLSPAFRFPRRKKNKRGNPMRSYLPTWAELLGDSSILFASHSVPTNSPNFATWFLQFLIFAFPFLVICCIAPPAIMSAVPWISGKFDHSH